MAKNLRKTHLDAISKKVALFIVQETYQEEEKEIQLPLAHVIQEIDRIAALCVANDEKAAAKE